MLQVVVYLVQLVQVLLQGKQHLLVCRVCRLLEKGLVLLFLQGKQVWVWRRTQQAVIGLERQAPIGLERQEMIGLVTQGWQVLQISVQV